MIREFRRYIRLIEREVEHWLKSQTDCCGVTMAQCHTLMELEDLGATSIVELAKRLRLDTSTLSRTVDSLVRDGHVERTTNPSNRRYVEVKLTAKGQQKADEINAVCDEFYRVFLARVPNSEAAILEVVKWFSELLANRNEDECCGFKCTTKGGEK
jgi:DNA-binding MarR family transcriptional regulator